MHCRVFVFFGLVYFISILLTTGKQTSFIIVRGCETKMHTYKLDVKSIPDCSKKCAGSKHCDGFNYDKSTGSCHAFNGINKNQGYMTLSDTITTVYKHKRTKGATKLFSIRAGSNQSSVDLWHGRGSWSWPSYRSPMIGCWERLGVRNVTFIVYYDGKSERICFDGTQSSSTSWFASNRIIESTLLQKGTLANIFSIDRVPRRHFFINKRYGGCQGDYGWVVIVDDDDDENVGCPWDKSAVYYPLIMCATNSRAVNWHNTNETKIASSVRILLHASLLNN